jgi:hypothetical protein
VFASPVAPLELLDRIGQESSPELPDRWAGVWRWLMATVKRPRHCGELGKFTETRR